MKTVSREELYELAWSKPMTRIAEQFGVSGSYLARIYTVLNVPRPERGYWAKLAVGKAPPPEPLPEARPGDQLYWSRDGSLPPSPTRPRIPPQSRPENKVRIPRTRIHGLIRGAKAHFEKTRPVEDGAYLKPYKKLLVDVITSAACLDRALDFANDLFNALESVGHRVIVAPSNERFRRANIDERAIRKKRRDNDYYYHNRVWSPWRPTVVYVGSMAIGLAIVEMSEEVVLRYVKGKYIRDADYTPPNPSRRYVDYTFTTTRELPSGRLRLVAYSPYGRVNWSTEWEETKRRASLRPTLKSIVRSIEKAAVDLVPMLEEADRQAEIEHQKWLADIERWKRKEDRRRVEESIQESQAHLNQIIQQWTNVMNVERFLAGVEEHATRLPEADRNPVLERLKLAREFLGTQNPLDFFLSWKAPDERYRPVYSDTEEYPTESSNS